MRHVSEEFENLIENGTLIGSIEIELKTADGKKRTIKGDNIMAGPETESSVSEPNAFNVGSAIIDKATITLNNLDGEFSGVDFIDAEIRISYIAKLNEREERIQSKSYIIYENPRYNGAVITLTGYDYMSKLDNECNAPVHEFKGPAYEMVDYICARNNLIPDIKSYAYLDGVKLFTDKKALKCTYRQLLLWVSQMSGAWAKITDDNRLSFIRPEKAHLAHDFNGNRHTIFGPMAEQICTSEIEITGISATYKNQDGDKEIKENILSGDKGYVIDVSDNPFVVSGSKSVALEAVKQIAGIYVGLKVRPLSVEIPFNPTIQAGDIAKITDHTFKDYITILTSVKHVLGSKTIISCGAKSIARQRSTRISKNEQTIVEIGEKVDLVKSAFDKTKEELADKMAKQAGLYSSSESNGEGTVYYLHDKPKRKESNVLWKMNQQGFSVSTDGGHTWNAGLDTSGSFLAEKIVANGISANAIKTGTFKVQDKEGNTTFSADTQTGEVIISPRAVDRALDINVTKELTAPKFPNGIWELAEGGVLIMSNNTAEPNIVDSVIGKAIVLERRAELMRVELSFFQTKSYGVEGGDNCHIMFDIASYRGDMTAAFTVGDGIASKTIKEGKRETIDIPFKPGNNKDGDVASIKLCIRELFPSKGQDGLFINNIRLYTPVTRSIENNKSSIENNRSSIEITNKELKSKVSNGEIDSIIEQKAESIRLKANKIAWDSDYSSMTSSGYLTCRRAKIEGSLTTGDPNYRQSKLEHGKMKVFDGGQEIGAIGSERFDTSALITTNGSTPKGVAFRLDKEGHFMSWSTWTKNGRTYSQPILTWLYTNCDVKDPNSGDLRFKGDSLNALCDLDLHSHNLMGARYIEAKKVRVEDTIEAKKVRVEDTIEAKKVNARVIDSDLGYNLSVGSDLDLNEHSIYDCHQLAAQQVDVEDHIFIEGKVFTKVKNETYRGASYHDIVYLPTSRDFKGCIEVYLKNGILVTRQ